MTNLSKSDRDVSIKLNGQEVEHPIARKFVGAVGVSVAGLVLFVVLLSALSIVAAVGVSVFALIAAVVGGATILAILDFILKKIGRRGIFQKQPTPGGVSYELKPWSALGKREER